MEKQRIHTTQAPNAVGPYSQAVQAGDFIFCSGQVGLDPETGALVEGDVQTQVRQVLTNLKHVLEAAGSSLDKAVKATVYLADINDFKAMNEVYASFFTEPYPARSAFAVKDLPVGALVEIEVIATK
jgi:2-iminobutanoate/2-iminopropanoate deaminase